MASSPLFGPLRLALAPLLRRGGPEGAWSARLRELAARGTVVHVLRGVTALDVAALDAWLERAGLPKVRYASDLPLLGLDDLDACLAGAGTAILALERPPSPWERLEEPAGSARRRADRDPIRRLLAHARATGRPVFLVPEVVLWTARAPSKERGVVDVLFGPRDFPGSVRAVATFLAGYDSVAVRLGEPIELGAYLAAEGAMASDEEDLRHARRVAYALLRRTERERRAVTGPVGKSPERVRGEVLRSGRLQALLDELAGPAPEARAPLLARADRLLRGLEARQDRDAIAVMERAFEATVARMYDGFEVDEAGLARLRELRKEGALVLLPSHKSHIDYILLTKILLDGKLPPPVIAAGDNLDFFPMGPILRAGGAFFIRRKFGSDRLYGAVVDAYVRRLLKDGHTLEFFLEGGRSRTGKLLTPKLGLLAMVVDAALGLEGEGKVFFCPIALAYERLPEEGAIVHELRGGEKAKESAVGLVKSAKVVLGNYGRVSVQFGEPMTLAAVAGAPEEGPLVLGKRERRALVTKLGHRVMNEIDRVTPVTPGALAATALLTHGGRAVDPTELTAYAREILALLTAQGARISPRLLAAADRAVLDATALFVEAGAVTVSRADLGPRPESRLIDRLVPRALRGRPTVAAGDRDALFFVRHDGRLPLDLAKNGLVHVLLDEGIVTLSLYAALRGEPAVSRTDLERRAKDLSRLFKYEFSFAADVRFAQSFDRTLAAMIARGEIVAEGDRFRPAAAGSLAERHLGLYGALLRNFVESYLVAASALRALRKGPLDGKDFVRAALRRGERLYLDGTIAQKEALSKPALESAIAAFESLGYVARAEGKIRLQEAFASEEGVALVEARVRAYHLPAGALPRPFAPRAD